MHFKIHWDSLKSQPSYVPSKFMGLNLEASQSNYSH